MKKLIIPFIAAFGISLGIATGAVIVRAPKAVVAAAPGTRAVGDSSPVAKDSTKDSIAPMADSSVARSHDSAGMPDSGKIAAVSVGEKAASAEQQRSTPAEKLQAVTKVAPPATSAKSDAHESTRRAEVPVVTPVTDSLINHRLAQVFAAMQAKDAARVLEQMNDSDVRAILGSLSSKQQAAILGSFPTARAASIVQTTLRTASNGGAK